MSSPRIDRWYRDAIDAVRSVASSRAGGGGFLLFFAPPETHGFIRDRLRELVEATLTLDVRLARDFDAHGERVA